MNTAPQAARLTPLASMALGDIRAREPDAKITEITEAALIHYAQMRGYVTEPTRAKLRERMAHLRVLQERVNDAAVS